MAEGISSPKPEEPDRTCNKCGVTKPATAFHRKGPDRRMGLCAECRSASRPASQRPPLTAEQRRANKLREYYSITVEQYEQLLAAQNGRCAACGNGPKGERPLAVDHCHASGRVRALLCDGCNIKIGAYKSFAHQAAEYLSRYGRGNPLLGYEAT